LSLEANGIADWEDFGSTTEKPITSSGTYFELVGDENVKQTLVYFFESEEKAAESLDTIVQKQQEVLETETLEREIDESYVDGDMIVITIVGSLEIVAGFEGDGNSEDNDGSNHDNDHGDNHDTVSNHDENTSGKSK
jgi:hypothetical protein